MHLSLSRRTLQRLLLLGLVVIAAAGFCVEFADDVLELEGVDAWLRFFSLSYERNLPTWYATCLLFLAAILLSLSEPGEGILSAGRFVVCARFERDLPSPSFRMCFEIEP